MEEAEEVEEDTGVAACLTRAALAAVFFTVAFFLAAPIFGFPFTFFCIDTILPHFPYRLQAPLGNFADLCRSGVEPPILCRSGVEPPTGTIHPRKGKEKNPPSPLSSVYCPLSETTEKITAPLPN